MAFRSESGGFIVNAGCLRKGAQAPAGADSASRSLARGVQPYISKGDAVVADRRRDAGKPVGP
jgi:hypothetical protein